MAKVLQRQVNLPDFDSTTTSTAASIEVASSTDVSAVNSAVSTATNGNKDTGTVTSYTSSGSVVYKTRVQTVTVTPTSKSSANHGRGSPLGSGAIAGIVVGCCVAILAIVGLFLLRRRRKAKVREDEAQTVGDDVKTETVTYHEKDGSQRAGNQREELHDRPMVFEPNSNKIHEMETPTSELEGDGPKPLKGTRSRKG